MGKGTRGRRARRTLALSAARLACMLFGPLLLLPPPPPPLPRPSPLFHLHFVSREHASRYADLRPVAPSALCSHCTEGSRARERATGRGARSGLNVHCAFRPQGKK